MIEVPIEKLTIKVLHSQVDVNDNLNSSRLGKNEKAEPTVTFKNFYFPPSRSVQSTIQTSDEPNQKKTDLYMLNVSGQQELNTYLNNRVKTSTHAIPW